MRKSMEGDGAEKVYRRRKSKWSASLSKCKMIYMVMAIVMFIIIENKLLMMMNLYTPIVYINLYFHYTHHLFAKFTSHGAKVVQRMARSHCKLLSAYTISKKYFENTICEYRADIQKEGQFMTWTVKTGSLLIA